ncbi:hypothetical protein MPDQ_005012 [Monascus purpureus]|uniref:VOC domain-containing protein n=1 Tax=Monascus purpureus TaxID=5098 RepID=A0A507R0R0_MONPU|nr:hypothetical protein MPDQ_005012 [Monascus purpureus]
MASSVKVRGVPHTGITVRSLPRAINLFRDILNLPVQESNHFCPPISTIVGHPKAEVEIAFVELPGGHLVKLLEYSSPPANERQVLKPRPWDVGNWHLCLVVESMERTAQALEAAGTGWVRMAPPQKLDKGPSSGMMMLYMRNEEDGLTLELFE